VAAKPMASQKYYSIQIVEWLICTDCYYQGGSIDYQFISYLLFENVSSVARDGFVECLRAIFHPLDAKNLFISKHRRTGILL